MVSKQWTALAALFLFLGFAAQAEVIGQVAGVQKGAELVTRGSAQAISPGTAVSSGDTIRTDASGSVQLVFIDRTRMVVGPNSDITLDDLQVASGNKASKFAVSAVGGTFRFLSGNSRKDVYSLKTPTATMGIRGTEFDFSVRGRSITNLVTFTGEVRICARGSNCARASGGCATVSATDRGSVIQPKSQEEKEDLLVADFPFIVSQESLQRDFRAPIGSCGSLGEAMSRAVVSPPSPPSSTSQRSSERSREADGGEEEGGYSESADENE